jgi:hypothetical protein
MPARGARVAVGVAAIAAAIAGCGSSSRSVKRPVKPDHAGVVGDCADPTRTGVVGDAPRLEHFDRDLDGDGRKEIVVAARSMCTAEGNCYWNVFIHADGCARFAGTIAGAALEPLSSTGDRGLRSLRAWWNLSGGGRLLMEEYRFRRGGYRVVDSLLCRRMDDDRIECAPTLRNENRELP